MKEKTVFVNAFLMLLLSVMLGSKLVIPVVSVPDIIGVPEDYPTIQEVIYAASAGDTIVVHEGLYAEGEIVVSKPLTLIAEGQVIVDGLHTGGDVISITSSSVVIEGFTVKNALYGGIWLWNVDDCIIEANTVTNNYVGISIEGCNNVVKGNRILDNYIGLYLNGMWRPTEHSVVEENVAENNSYAINLWYSHHNVIRHNTLNDNNNASIIIHFSDHNAINENKVTNTDQVGIALLMSDSNIVNENVVTDNGLGIGLSGSYYNVVKGNRADRNTYYGILIYYSGGNTVEQNRAFQNGEFDLYWEIGYNTWTENKYKTKNW